MDVFGAHLSTDNARVCGIHQDIWMPILCYLAIEVPGIQDRGQFGPPVLGIRPNISIELVQSLEACILGSTIVQVTGLVDNANHVSRLGRRLHEGEKMRG